MYYGKNSIIFLNGNFIKAKDAKIDLFQQSLHYGNGVFEGIRAYDTPDGPKIFKAREHFERLEYSAAKMHTKLKYTVEELSTFSYKLLAHNDFSNAYIRPLVFTGPNMRLTPTEEVHVMIATWEWGRYLGDKLINVMTSTYQRPNPRSCHVEAKVSGHYVNSILATTEARNKGYDEAIMLDYEGYVAQAPGANLFYEKDEILYTPSRGSIFPGITRATIIELATELGVQVIEKKFTLEEFKDADAAFFTGTAAEVIGIGTIDKNKFHLNWEDSIGYILARMYYQRVTNKGHKNFALV